jgi:hypothetical protein
MRRDERWSPWSVPLTSPAMALPGRPSVKIRLPSRKNGRFSS